MKEWAIRKCKTLLEMWEYLIDVVRAVGEVLQALMELLWKIGNFFGKLGLFILKSMELMYNRQPAEVEEGE